MKALKPFLPVLTVLVTIGGSVFAVGQQLGHAEAKAAYWERYVEGLAKPECR